MGRRLLVAVMVFMILLASAQAMGSVSASPPRHFNPFSIPQVRLAVQYLVNRSYISSNVTDNSAYPVLGPPSSIYSLLNLTTGGNFKEAVGMIDTAMEKLKARGYPLDKVKGTWYYSGRPVVVRLFIPSAYPYRQIGFYVAALLQRAGLMVNKFVVNYRTIYTKVLSSRSGWDVYVGGVTVPNITSPELYLGMRPLEFSNVTVAEMLGALGESPSGAIKTLNLTNYTVGELVSKLMMNERDLLFALLSGQYKRNSVLNLEKLLTALSVFSSERIPLVRMREYYAYNSSMGAPLRLGMYSPSDSIIWGPFDPLTGILDPNSAYLWNLMSQHECNVTVKVGNFKVPSSAVPFSSTLTRSKEEVSYVCREVNWTNGQSLTTDDFLYYLKFLETYGGRLYSELLQNVIAFQPRQGNGTVGYTLYLREPSYASLYEFYPPLPWDVSFAVAQLISNGSSYGITEKFSLYGENGTIPVNLAGVKTVKALERVINALRLSGRVPGFVDSKNAEKRYSADLEFVSKNGNLLVGTGPYLISELSNDSVTLRNRLNGSKVTFVGFFSPINLVNAFESGRIDGVATPLPREFYGNMSVPALLHTKFLSVNDTYVYLFFNTPSLSSTSTTSTSTTSTSTTSTTSSTSTSTSSSTSTHTTSTTSTSTSSTTLTHTTSSSSVTSSTSSSSSPTSSSSPSSTTSKKKHICGPAALVGISLVPLLLRKRSKR